MRTCQICSQQFDPYLSRTTTLDLKKQNIVFLRESAKNFETLIFLGGKFFEPNSEKFIIHRFAGFYRVLRQKKFAGKIALLSDFAVCHEKQTIRVFKNYQRNAMKQQFNKKAIQFSALYKKINSLKTRQTFYKTRPKK